MVVMIDEIFDRTYQAGRADLHDGVDRLVRHIGRTVGDAFKVLNRIEYSAPWLERGRTTRRA
jgi:hypothetical protein